MVKGLFTSMEEVVFHKVYVQGNIAHPKGFSRNARQISLDNQRISQNVKRLNKRAQHVVHVR